MKKSLALIALSLISTSAFAGDIEFYCTQVPKRMGAIWGLNVKADSVTNAGVAIGETAHMDAIFGGGPQIKSDRQEWAIIKDENRSGMARDVYVDQSTEGNAFMLTVRINKSKRDEYGNTVYESELEINGEKRSLECSK